VIPLFFGDANKPLFGIHHQPTASSQLQDTSIVLCNPIGFEYGRTHSVIGYLAKKLAAKGYHVLRFDYYATGDSSGNSEDISIEQCIKDIVLSCDEIKTISATRKVSVVGYRYGALLAAFASEHYKFSRLIMWDPIVDGETYLNDLQKIHNNMLTNPNRFDLNFLSNTTSPSELIGHYFSENLREKIKSLNLADLEKIKTKRIDIFSYSDSYNAESLINENTFLSKATMHKFDIVSDWNDSNKIETKMLPDSSIETILEVIG